MQPNDKEQLDQLLDFDDTMLGRKLDSTIFMLNFEAACDEEEPCDVTETTPGRKAQ